MVKKQDKSQRDIPPVPEESRYKKKSGNKGLPRSRHKHTYKTVLVHHKYSLTKAHDPHPWKVDYYSATKVCTVCGRIGTNDQAFYTNEFGYNNLGRYLESKLTMEAYNLELWVADDAFCKFAHRAEVTK